MTRRNSKDEAIEFLRIQNDLLRLENAELKDEIKDYREELEQERRNVCAETDKWWDALHKIAKLKNELKIERQHCDDISRIKAERQKEIERLKTPTPDGRCAVCGSYVGERKLKEKNEENTNA